MKRGRAPWATVDRPTDGAAFALSDLIFVLAALTVLVVTAVAHQNIGPRTERLVCGNNLRQVGVAFQEWADAFDDKLPWLLPTSAGGTGGIGNPLIDNGWYHFLTLSNYLSSPSFLACPSDNSRTATKWDSSPDGGFVNPAFRANALSYIVGCHSDMRLPRQILSADRNILPDSFGSCSIGFQSVMAIAPRNFGARGWSGTNIHFSAGNILSTDGSVADVSTAAFLHYASDVSETGVEHYVLPR